MKLFISWSGDLSHKIAIELKEWFPSVINQLEPFVSSENIKKGDRWMIDIYSELEESNFGIVCLTRENLTAPWILFEAGALSKNINQSRVSCILFDNLSQQEIKSPLSLFQNTAFDKEDFKKLVLSINNALGEKKISETLLNKSFEKWFPELEEKIIQIVESYSPTQPQKKEGDNMLNEILRNTKYISNVVARFNLKLPENSLDFAKFTNETEIFFSEKNNNHPIQVFINPVNDYDGKNKQILITKKGIEVSDSPGPNGRGVLIEILFFSEHDVLWNMTFHFHKGDTYVKTSIVDLSEEEAKNIRLDTIWRD